MLNYLLYLCGMKNIVTLIRRFVPSYKRFVVANFGFNILSTILNLFSFAAIIPILQIIFGITPSGSVKTPMSDVEGMEAWIEAVKGNTMYEIEQLIATHGEVKALMFIGLFLIVMTFFKTLSAFLASASLVPIRTGVLRDIRNQIYAKMTSLPIGYYSEERKGDIMSRMTSDVVEIETSIMSSLELIFKNPIMIVVYIFTLFAMSWELTTFVIVLLPISGWFIGKIGRNLKRKSLKGQEETGELLSQIEETLGGLRIVKAFNAEDKLGTRFGVLNEKIRSTFNAIHTRYLMAHPVSEFLGTTVIAVLLWYGGYVILSGDSALSGPAFIYYLVIFYSIVPPFKDLSKATYSVQKGMASLQRVDDVLMAENPICDKDGAIGIDNLQKDVVFEDVWFKYKEAWVLKGINLRVEKGKTVALVGQSGSGKSTMVDLIPRFWDIQKGSVKIDGVDVRDLKIADLRGLMGNVNQEAILFNDSIRNNIAFGVDSSTNEEVENAAKMANAHDFIIATEEGYDTNIGDRGGRLSGGQRQRISIARALLKNPDILILDEATSALDTESERLVQDAIDNLMKNRTTIVIAHRLSTIKNADEICVMHEGEIVERGRHEELISKDGYYKKLVDMQGI